MQNRKELPKLFFETKQLIRSKLPRTASDHNEWMRCEVLRFIDTSSTAPTMREVADYLRVKAPSATSIVRLLDREGLITRAKGNGDKRVVRIIVTKKGKTKVERYLADAAETMTRVFSKMPDEDVASLVRILRSLHEAHRK